MFFHCEVFTGFQFFTVNMFSTVSYCMHLKVLTLPIESIEIAWKETVEMAKYYISQVDVQAEICIA